VTRRARLVPVRQLRSFKFRHPPCRPHRRKRRGKVPGAPKFSYPLSIAMIENGTAGPSLAGFSDHRHAAGARGKTPRLSVNGSAIRRSAISSREIPDHTPVLDERLRSAWRNRRPVAGQVQITTNNFSAVVATRSDPRRCGGLRHSPASSLPGELVDLSRVAAGFVCAGSASFVPPGQIRHSSIERRGRAGAHLARRGAYRDHLLTLQPLAPRPLMMIA